MISYGIWMLCQFLREDLGNGQLSPITWEAFLKCWCLSPDSKIRVLWGGPPGNSIAESSRACCRLGQGRWPLCVFHLSFQFNWWMVCLASAQGRMEELLKCFFWCRCIISFSHKNVKIASFPPKHQSAASLYFFSPLAMRKHFEKLRTFIFMKRICIDRYFSSIEEYFYSSQKLVQTTIFIVKCFLILLTVFKRLLGF